MYYTLCLLYSYILILLYHSNTEAVLFACLSSGWTNKPCRLLGSKVGNSIKCLSQGYSDTLLHTGLGTHLFVKAPRPGDSEVIFSVFESSCHLLLPV